MDFSKVVNKSIIDMKENNEVFTNDNNWILICNEYILDNLPLLKGFDVNNCEHVENRFELAFELAHELNELWQTNIK